MKSPDRYKHRIGGLELVGSSGAAPSPLAVRSVRVGAVDPPWGELAAWISFACWLIGFAIYAATLGPDASYDLRNYHIYNPFAVVHGRYGFDIAPGQLQTYFNPTADFPGYYLRWVLADQSRLLNAILAVPYAIGAQIVTLIAVGFVSGRTWQRWVLAMLAAGFGMTGAATLPTIATTQSGILPDCCVLAGLHLLLKRFGAVGYMAHPRLRPIGVGLAFGVGLGLKLTAVAYCFGAGAALMVAWPGPIRAKLEAGVVFGLAMVIGAAVVAGWWWLRLWQDFGNPVFPFYNGLFGSPHAELDSATDERFKPEGWLQALFYPVYWGIFTDHPIAELPMRDPRMMLALVALVVAALGAARNWSADRRQLGMLLVFFGASYIAWEALFSILRYLAPLEMLSGVIILLALRLIGPTRRPMLGPGLACLIALGTAALTKHPAWERGEPGANALEIKVPSLDPNGLLLVLDGTPASYIVPFVPPTVRVVGIRNNLVWPERPTLLQERVASIVRGYRGPLYGLETPGSPEAADDSLEYYRLRRMETHCSLIEGSLDPVGIRFCPLLRTEGAR